MTSTLLQPVDRAQKLLTNVDRAAPRRGASSDLVLSMFGAALANHAFDNSFGVPAMTGPGQWQPGLVYDRREDSWVNKVTGFGTALDKTQFTEFRPSNWLSDNSLEALFHDDGITKRAVMTIPKEMMRKGFCLDIDGKPDKDTEMAILDAWDELEASRHFIRARTWGRLFGDGAVIIGADDGRPTMLPLVPEQVRKIDWIDSYDRRFYAINSYYQSGPKYGQPETYALGNPGALTARIQLVHETRMIRFGGAMTTEHVRRMRGGFDASTIQAMFETLRSFSTGYKAAELLLTDGAQGVYKIKNLQQLLVGGNKSMFEQRLQAVDMFRSAMRAIVVDTDSEDFHRENITLTGVSDVLDRLGSRLAADIPMPVTKLMGVSPGGLNATGDSDMRNWYDELETDQISDLAPPIKRFLQIMCASKEGPTKGNVPKRITITFHPLWTLDPLQESTRRLNVAQADKIYVVDIQAATSEEVGLTRFTDRGYNGDGINIDRELRQTLIDRDRAEQMAEPVIAPPLELISPEAATAAISVDEARAAMGVPPEEDEAIGDMKLAEYLAKLGGATQPGSHPTDPAQNKPNGFETPDPNKAPENDPSQDPNQPSAQGPGGPPKKATPAK